MESKHHEMRKPGPEMEKMYRKHAPDSFHSSIDDDDDSYFEKKWRHESHEEDQGDYYQKDHLNHRLQAQWRNSGNGRWHEKHYQQYEKKAEITANKEKSEPFYEYLQLIPNPDFFRPHVEYSHHDNHHDKHHDNHDADEKFQKQRMQEQR